jgi:radical SAM superfamily enzyme YgiQ (UPF0313 family)
MSDFTSWYEGNYPFLIGHGLWLRGGELNTVPAAEYDLRFFRLLIARLSTAMDTRDSFTHLFLYELAKKEGEIFPDLAYLPPQQDTRLFEKGGVPWLLGTTSKRGPLDFDLIGFSNSFAAELMNLPVMMKKSGLPLRKSERLEHPEIPLVLLGGANALYTSIFWISDPPVDGIFLGEDPGRISALFRICREGKRAQKQKAEVLAELETVAGFFQPDSIKKTRRYFDFESAAHDAMEEAPVLFLDDSKIGTGHIQISEGCPCFCSFCSESFNRKPYREVPAATVREQALRMKAGMGLSKMELSSFNFNMHSDFYRILWELSQLFDIIGLKSQRFDLLARDPDMPAYLHAIGKTSLTCGIEGISNRLRRYLHKNLKEEELHKSLEVLFRFPLRELKLFFIATGIEEEKDYTEFGGFLEFLAALRAARRPRFIFSVTPLLRFPWTPLEFEEGTPPERMQAVLRKIKALVTASGFEFRQSASLSDYVLSQLLVRASDERITKAFLRTIEETGEIYYKEVSQSFLNRLQYRLRGEGLDIEELLRGHSVEEGVQKPWALLEPGVDREFLARQFRLSRAFRERPYCLGSDRKTGVCIGCGACRDDSYKEKLTHARPARPPRVNEFETKLQAFAKDRREIPFLVFVEEKARGVPRKAVGAALARALMKAVPDYVEWYRGFKGSFWQQDEHPTWVTGDDGISLFWLGAGIGRLRADLNTPLFLDKVNFHMEGWARLLGLSEGKIPDIVLKVTSPFEFRGEDYLKSRGMKYTSRKLGEGSYRFDFTADSIKKKYLNHLTLKKERDGEWLLSLTPGERFNPTDFTKEAFLLPSPSDFVRIRVKAAFRLS